MAKEIEIKIELSNLQETIRHLEGLGCRFSEVIHQIDDIFIPQAENVLPVKPGVNVLRTRTQGEKTFFTLKQSDPKNHLAKIEKELEIKDRGVIHEAIELLGYHKISEVDKMRRTCHCRDFEICVDEVKGLGSFMEVEKNTDEDPESVQ